MRFNLTEWLRRFPSTNGRIAVTLGLSIATGVVYLGLAVLFMFRLTPEAGDAFKTAHAWEPAIEWLGFLVTLAGIDTVQFFTKRKTNGVGVPALGTTSTETRTVTDIHTTEPTVPNT